MPRQYPEEFKKQVVSFCAAGNSLSVASEKYQLAQSTLYRLFDKNVRKEGLIQFSE